MGNRNCVSSKMRRWTFMLTVIVVVVASNDEYSDKLPITLEQMNFMIEDLCIRKLYDGLSDIDVDKIKICQYDFLNPKEAPTKFPLPAAQGVMTSPATATINLPPSEEFKRLIVLVPLNDSNAIINYGILEPNETFFEACVEGQKDLQIWSTILDTTAKLGLWRRGPKILNWGQQEFLPITVQMKNNFTLVNSHFLNRTVKLEFVWNGTHTDIFSVRNLCQKADLGKIFETTTRNKSVVIENLKLNDHCIITVEGSYGNGSLVYDTPTEIDGFWEPEIPKITSIWSVPGPMDNSWEVTVNWSAPAHPVTEYKITVTTGNNTRHAVVSGNMTKAIINNVIGEEIYSVTLESVSPMGNAHTTRKALFPRVTLTNDLTVAGMWCIALLVSISAVTGFLRIRKYRRDQASSIFQDYPDMKFPKDIDTFGHSYLIAEDGWEVRPDRLVLHEVIGEGEFGVVRRGSLEPDGKMVAVKMLKDQPTVEEIRSFRGEMELMKSVGGDRHVVSLVGCCSRQRPLMITEYCSRGNLLNYLRCACNIMMCKRNANYNNNNIDFVGNYRNDLFKNQPNDHTKIVVNKLYDMQGVCDTELTPVDLLSFCRQIAMGMEFLASNRVVHRDLAARNVLVTADKTLKIADFGLSRDVYQENQYKQNGTAKLPIKWMALESLTRRVYTSQSDVWSFGVVIWEVVTVGGAPYSGVSVSQLPRMLLSGYRMPRPTNCSTLLYEVMRECWRARARERPTFAELHHRLDALLNSVSADNYLTLDIDFDADEALLTPKPERLTLLARTKRYWSNKYDSNTLKAESYERPLHTQSNHYTSPPDTLSRIQVT